MACSSLGAISNSPAYCAWATIVQIWCALVFGDNCVMPKWSCIRPAVVGVALFPLHKPYVGSISKNLACLWLDGLSALGCPSLIETREHMKMSDTMHLLNLILGLACLCPASLTSNHIAGKVWHLLKITIQRLPTVWKSDWIYWWGVSQVGHNNGSDASVTKLPGISTRSEFCGRRCSGITLLRTCWI
jgi:hypothetical protein